MTYKKVIAGSLGAVVALGAFAVIGVSPLSALTSTTTVNVTIEDECGIGVGTDTGGAGTVTIAGLSSTVPAGEQTASASPIMVTCNNAAGWGLTEEMNEDEDQILNIGGQTASTVGFAPWSSGSTVAAFATNTWGAKYAQVAAQTGASVASAATNYHAVPANGAAIPVASGTGPSVSYGITQTFGAKTDGMLAAGTYTGIVLYTLTGN